MLFSEPPMSEQTLSKSAWRKFQLAAVLVVRYGFGFKANASVGQSALKSGEYNNSHVGLGTQALTLNTSIQF